MSVGRDFYNLRALLKQRGYNVSDDYIWSVIDYLDLCPDTYTIFDWLEDTEKNYPDTLKGEGI